jgi:predicted Fe-Mo cluster-binding NifX family protein
MVLRVAVASTDGKFINQHFGHAPQFLIFDINDDGSYEFLELRENAPSCTGGNHASGALKGTLDIIKDSQVVLVSQIGPGASQFLLSHGIQPFMIPTFIDEALNKLAARVTKTRIETSDDVVHEAAGNRSNE